MRLKASSGCTRRQIPCCRSVGNTGCELSVVVRLVRGGSGVGDEPANSSTSYLFVDLESTDSSLATQAWVTANAGGIPSGTVIMVAGSTPSGYVPCDGATYNGTQATYATLYTVIGTTYGGTGVSAFKVPDLRGRVAVGQGTGAGLQQRNLGAQGGEEAHQITVAEMPAHTHTTGITTGTQGYSGGNTIYSQDAGAGGRSTSSTGGNGWLSLMQPFTVLRYCIKL